MKQNSIDRKYRNLNDFLRCELRRKKISQRTVATWLGIPPSCVSQRLSGEIEWSAREIISIYELMGIEHEWSE